MFPAAFGARWFGFEHASDFSGSTWDACYVSSPERFLLGSMSPLRRRRILQRPPGSNLVRSLWHEVLGIRRCMMEQSLGRGPSAEYMDGSGLLISYRSVVPSRSDPVTPSRVTNLIPPPPSWLGAITAATYRAVVTDGGGGHLHTFRGNDLSIGLYSTCRAQAMSQ